MDELDRSPQPGSDPPVGPPPPDATGPSDSNPPDDPAPPAPEDVPDGPPEVAGADADPRALAAASQPPNVSDILAEQAALDQGADGQGKAPYGEAGLKGGAVNLPASSNPLTRQRAQDAAAKKSAEDAATKDPKKGAESGGVNLEKPDKPSKSAELAKNLANEGLDLARKNPKYGRYIPYMPEGDTTGDKAAHLAGQGTNIGLRAWSDSYAPGAYDVARNSLLGRVATSALLNAGPIGKLLNQSEKFRKFRDGLNAGVKNDGQVSKREKIQIFVVASLPILLPLIAMILIIALVLGVGVSGIDEEDQPSEASDREVAEYFPGNWQRILKAAAFRASFTAQDYSTVPWTILAGLVKTQTDFARYSPYDNIDRDPGRTSKELPSSGGGEDGGDGVNVDVSNTRGAGPGPVEGVSGAGSTAVVPGSGGHERPPDGNFSQQLGWFLWALRMHESNGDYQANAGTSASTACGAYQYIGSTWNNYEGYATACDAPAAIQDKRAKRDIIAKWNQFGKWQQVAAQHFTGSWGNQPERWNDCPAACDFNPTVWEYVDGVIGKMRSAAAARPPRGNMQPASFRTGDGGAAVLPADVPGAAPADAPGRAPGGDAEAPPTATDANTGPSTTDGGTGLFASGCAVPNPDPEIGGEDDQGSGPYLLTPAAAAQMRSGGLDPQDPCSSSFWVARELSKTAKLVHADPKSPNWKSDGDEKDQENARKYWSKVIETSGIFMDRSGAPGEACTIPPPDDPEEPWSISYKIISVWRCETTRIQDLYLVTNGEYEGEEFKYTIQEDRAGAIQTLVNEALSVSYGASKWKTEECDNADEEKPQGIFPMTKEEAEEAEVTDRCDVEKNIAGAAKLVLSVERTPPKERPDELGVFQPMIGGWEKLGIAMGTDLDLFALIGPGRNGYEATDECTQVMTQFLTDAAPHASEFAELTEPPSMETVYSEWRPKLDALEEAHGLTNPSSDPACRIGSWAPGFNNTVAQIASGLAGDSPHSTNLSGLSKYYQGREDANTEMPPVVGEDTLVIPRLALRPLKPIGAPVAADAGQAWSQLGSNEGVTLPLSQVAVEYAWFFGGVIPPFNSAGKLIGSLENGGGGTSDGSGPVQVEVGPDGCPKEAPKNTLREGATEIGINKLCVDSVAQARTPEAAKAIKWALTHLGWSYTMNTVPSNGPTRNDPEWADCSSFVSRAYRSAIPGLYSGNAPTTGTLRTNSWTTKIPFSQLKPGDLVEPNSGHVAMQLANGYKVHTNTGSDVSRVERAYSSAFWSGWVNANNR